MAATLFVGLLGIAVIFTNAAVTDMLLGNLALASLGTSVILLGPALLSWWAHNVKQEHKSKVNDGSFSYRLSQMRYIIALLTLAAIGVLLFLAIARHQGRG